MLKNKRIKVCDKINELNKEKRNLEIKLVEAANYYTGNSFYYPKDNLKLLIGTRGEILGFTLYESLIAIDYEIDLITQIEHNVIDNM